MNTTHSRNGNLFLCILCGELDVFIHSVENTSSEGLDLLGSDFDPGEADISEPKSCPHQRAQSFTFHFLHLKVGCVGDNQ